MNSLKVVSTAAWLLVGGALGKQGHLKGYSSEATADQITSLPGLSSDIIADYTMFSGYINVDGNGKRNVFYWFVESLNDPANDPVFFWTNGGPGCSGLGGMWSEQGPFRVLEDMSVEVNPDSWVRAASGIFVEQPAGVGFSYCTDRADETTGDYQAAEDNLAFIHAWLNKFSNFASNDFYTTSESYGGHYMPTLAQTIVKANNAGAKPTINYKGFFVGNPYTDPNENAKGMYDTWFGHQLVSQPSWQSWYTSCKDGTVSNPACLVAMETLYEEVGNDIDPYALDYPVCQNNQMINAFFLQRVIKEGLGRPIPKYYERLWPLMKKYYTELLPKMVEARRQGIEDYPQLYATSDDGSGNGQFPDPNYQECASNYMTTYLNLASVQEAIHVNTSEVRVWSMCSYTLNYNRSDSETPMEPIYQWLVSNSDLRITVVSGDDDSVCGTIGTQSWIWNLGYDAKSDSNWNSWSLDSDEQVAGYVTEFETNTDATLKFVTVHGAGHMIPQTEGKRSYQSFVNYLKGIF